MKFSDWALILIGSFGASDSLKSSCEFEFAKVQHRWNWNRMQRTRPTLSWKEKKFEVIMLSRIFELSNTWQIYFKCCYTCRLFSYDKCFDPFRYCYTCRLLSHHKICIITNPRLRRQLISFQLELVYKKSVQWRGRWQKLPRIKASS